MDTKTIKELVDIFQYSNLNSLDLEMDNLKLKLAKSTTDGQVVYKHVDEPSKMIIENKGHEITSMLVGTFYKASSANMKPFIEVGQQVKVDDTLCIIEAMKVMNEIKSDVNGIVKEICFNDGDLVQYGDVIVVIEEN